MVLTGGTNTCENLSCRRPCAAQPWQAPLTGLPSRAGGRLRLPGQRINPPAALYGPDDRQGSYGDRYSGVGVACRGGHLGGGGGGHGGADPAGRGPRPPAGGGGTGVAVSRAAA